VLAQPARQTVTDQRALAFPKAQFVFVDTEWTYWTGSRSAKRAVERFIFVVRD
jgi:hypothetical protein